MAPRENANEASSPGCSTPSLSRDGRIGTQKLRWLIPNPTHHHSKRARKDDARTIHAVSRELADSNLPWQPGRHLVIGTPANRYDLAEDVTALGVADLGPAFAALQ